MQRHVLGIIIATPKDVCSLIPGIGRYVTLYGKGEFANVIKDMDFRCDDYSGFFR